MLKRCISVLLIMMIMLGVLTAFPISASADSKITVYFINNKNWSAVNIYTWNPEPTKWPGETMTFVRNEETTGSGIYCAQIDPSTEGIVFNMGTSESQTVDITTGISDGTGWYISGEDNGKYTVSSFVYSDDYKMEEKKQEKVPTILFGSYYQSKVTDPDELEILSYAEFKNDRVTVNGTKYIRKGNRYDYAYYRSEPIEWRIIGQENGCYCLMSDKVIEHRRFAAWEDFWSSCELRTWLNSDFMDEAFTKEERSCIELSDITNIESNYDNRPGGGRPFEMETKDYVYLLTKDEIESLYEPNERIAKATQYVNDSEGNSSYWLRGPKLWKYGIKMAYYVNGTNGNIGSWYPTWGDGVRPVIKISKTASGLTFRDEQGLELNRLTVYRNRNKSTEGKDDYVAAKGVIVSYNNTDYTTDENGNVFLPRFEDGNVTFTKSGYISRSLTTKQLCISNCVYLEQKNDKGPVIYAVWIGDADILHTVYPLSMLSTESVTIRAEVDWGSSEYSGLNLAQKEKRIPFKNNVLTTTISDNFDTSEAIRLIATDKNKKAVERELLIQNGATGQALTNLDGLEIAFTDNMDFTIPNDFPVLGGTKLSTGIKTLVPVTIAANKGKVYVAIGLDLVNYSLKNNKDPKNPKKLVSETKTFIDAFKDAKLLDATDAADKIKKFSENYKKALKKPVGDFGITVDCTVLGFAEGTYDETGHVEFYNSGAILQPSGSISKEFPFVYPVINIPGYFETCLSAKASAKINFAHNEQAKKFLPNSNVTGGISLSGGVGVGVNKVLYASGGIKGNLSADWSIKRGATDHLLFKASLTSYAKAGIMGFEGEHEFKYDCLETTLYEYPSNRALSSTGAVQDNLYDTSAYTVKDLSYLENVAADNKALAFTGANENGSVLKSEIYRESTPELIELDNGTKFVIWTDASVNNINDICLYYSYYNGVSWSAPKLLCNDGTMDYAPYVLRSGENVYVTWQNAEKRFDNINELGLDDIASDFNIAVASWNGSGFNTVNIPYAGLDMQPVLCTGSDSIHVVWINNAAGSWLGDNDRNSIVACTYKNGVCSDSEVLYSGLNSIGCLTADEDQGLKVAYTMDTDGDIKTFDDLRVFENGVRVTENDSLESSPIYVDHTLYLYTNNNILPADSEEFTEGNISSDKCRLLKTSNGLAAVYTQADGLYSSLCVSYYNDVTGCWGDPVTLCDNHSFIGAFSADIGADNQLTAVINDRTVIETSSDNDPYADSQLRYVTQEKSCDIAIGEPNFLSSTFCVDKPMIFSFDITNNSSVTVDSVLVTITDDDDTLLSSYTVYKKIVPGETVRADAYYIVPEAVPLQRVSITAKPIGIEDTDLSNNAQSADLSYENIRVDNLTTAKKEDNSTVLSADIINFGYSKAEDLTIHLRQNTADGAILSTRHISSIDPMSSCTVTFEIDSSQEALYYVTVECDDTEYTADNEDFIRVGATPNALLGDVDLDGYVEIRDATWIQRHVAEIDMPITISTLIADVDGDGYITVVDATAVQYYLAKLRVSYPIGEQVTESTAPAVDIDPSDYEYQKNSDNTVTITKYNGLAKKLTIPGKLDGCLVTAIGKGAFERNTTLESVVIPNTVSFLDSRAFGYCSSLKSVTIPESVTSAGQQTFVNCTSLTEVVIPRSLKIIPVQMFYMCSSLQTISLPDTVKEISSAAFTFTAWYNDQPDGLLYLGKFAYVYKGLCPSAVTIKPGTVGIADYAFYVSPALTSITIPNSVKSIGECAFKYCNKLSAVDIPDSVTDIGEEAFFDCKMMEQVTIPYSVTSIGRYSFGYYKMTDDDGWSLPENAKKEDFIVCGYKYTEAERYANNNEFAFRELSS